MSKRKYVDYEDVLKQDLKDPEEAAAYLNAALADEDERVFMLALKDVQEALGKSMTEIAANTQLNRENLYRALSRKGNPKLSTLRAILNELGINISFSPVQK